VLRAVQAGFPDYWQVASEYAIENGVLRAHGPIARRYLPGAYPQIATDLAKIDGGGERGVLVFAEDWGLLGYARLVEADKSLSQDERNRRLDLVLSGDPIPWIQAHAHGVRVCTELIGALTSQEPTAATDLAAYLDALAASYAHEPEAEGNPAVEHGLRHEARLLVGSGAFTRDSEAGPERGRARTLIQGVINPNLADLQPRLTDWPALDELALNYGFVALTDVIYWHLAQFALGRGRLARCQECHYFFPQTDRRQRFCPPAGWRGEQAESRCAMRFRTRRMRARAKTQEGEGNV
jgi:hypothetical protein